MAKGKYQLLHNTAYIDYTGDEEVEIGKIVDASTGEDIMYIYYSRSLFKDRGYHICVDVYESEDREFPVVNTDDLHRACLFDRPDIFLAIMLHEYGHYKNGDLTAKGVTSEMLANERMQCILEGRVQEQERKADAFAVSCVGKNTFLRSLDYLINKRKQRGDDGMALALKEFELRKKAIRKMK